MSGYRLDDDWSQSTTETGEPMSGSWRVIVAFAGVVAAVILVGTIGHFPLGRTLCLFIAVALFWTSALSVLALRRGIRQRYFEAGRFGRIYKAGSGATYWLYLGFHAVLLPIAFAVAVLCAAAVYLNPFAR